MTDAPLSKAREKIDAIDKAILDLIEKRANLAVDIAKIKSKQPDSIYYRPEREAQILREIMAQHSSPLDSTIIAKIFREIISGCLNLQKQLQVAYLGPEGTFSQIAMETHFGNAIQSIPQKSIDDIFHAVSQGHADYGIVPIENSTAGAINITLDTLINTSLHICGEIEIPIHHQLIRQKDDVTPITCIYAHEQTLAQCRSYLHKHFPKTPTKSTNSNSAAAVLVSKEKGLAMIGADTIPSLYDLTIIKKNIEDSSHNKTRFIILGNTSPAPSGQDKTSLLIATPQAAGSLLDLIKPFETHDISMTSISSRPYQQHNWSYLFFIDIEGHQDDDNVKQALNELSENSVMLTILGSYPKAVL